MNDSEENMLVRILIVTLSFNYRLTKVIGMDCEMVGVGDGEENMLARVSIVNQYGEMVYDKFVKPMEDVVDYRTHVSGVRKHDLESGSNITLCILMDFSYILIQEVLDCPFCTFRGHRLTSRSFLIKMLII